MYLAVFCVAAISDAVPASRVDASTYEWVDVYVTVTSQTIGFPARHG